MTQPWSGRPAMVAATLVATWVLTQAGVPAAPPRPPALDTIPLELGAWAGTVAPPLADEIAKVIAADQYVHRFYEGPGGVIEMDVAYYSQPKVGSNMHSPLNCLPGTGWQIRDVRGAEIASLAGTWPVREIIVERGATKYAMTYWYQSRYRIVDEEVRARFHVLGDALRRRPADAGLVRLMMPAGEPAAVGERRAVMAAFAERLMPEIARRLR